MKYILPIALIVFVTFFSCAKSDSLEQQEIKSQKTSNTDFNLARPNPNQLLKDYNVLVAKLKAGEITFEVFHSNLKALLAPYKRSKSSKSLLTFSLRTSSWNYIPGPCDYENDPVGCREFWYTECMSFCMEQYYMITDALMMEEDAAYIDFLTARENCNNSYMPGSARDSCMTAEATAYAIRLNPIIAAYNYASNDLYTCEASCGY